MTDWEIVEEHIQNMEEAITQLIKYRNIPMDEFEKDLSLIWVVEKGTLSLPLERLCRNEGKGPSFPRSLSQRKRGTFKEKLGSHFHGKPWIPASAGMTT